VVADELLELVVPVHHLPVLLPQTTFHHAQLVGFLEGFEMKAMQAGHETFTPVGEVPGFVAVAHQRLACLLSFF